MTTTTKTEFYVRGLVSGWRRGPFKTEDGATLGAEDLAREKRESVDVERRVTTTTVETAVVGTIKLA